jgi:hypothetical protein
MAWFEIPSFLSSNEKKKEERPKDVLREGQEAQFEDWFQRLEHERELERLEKQKKINKISFAEPEPTPKPKRSSRFNMMSLRRSMAIIANTLKQQRCKKWLKSFLKLDPRYQILKHFNIVAHRYADASLSTLSYDSPSKQTSQSTFNSEDDPDSSLFLNARFPAAFTVWRPTSKEAIVRMMKGEVTGKGMDVKGKSAKGGCLSGLIPFVQIHNNDHKSKVLRPPKGGRMKIFYKSNSCRFFAEREMNVIAQEMKVAVQSAKRILSKTSSATDEARRNAMKSIVWDVTDFNIYQINETSGEWGLNIAERVFFESYIVRKSVERCKKYESCRPSEPAFQDMNFATTRISNDPRKTANGNYPVVLQTNEDDAISDLYPRSLVVAYQDINTGKVTPVASDFDCFLMGTRAVDYPKPLPPNQIDVMKGLIDEIEKILSEKKEDRSWTQRWLDLLKEKALMGSHKVEVPAYGFGDPKSYKIMEKAVAHFKSNKNGAVCHGAEAFNYVFPQELDEQFLVIMNDFPGNIPWKYVGQMELKGILNKKIDDGFCFPINPKWILADRGWKELYDKMINSKNETTKAAMEVWYPRESGIRERLNELHKKFPKGFSSGRRSLGDDFEGREAMDHANEEFRRYITLQRAKSKLRAALALKPAEKLTRSFYQEPNLTNQELGIFSRFFCDSCLSLGLQKSN